MMDRRDFDEKVIDFLYEDLDAADRSEFVDGLRSNAEFEGETRDFRRVGQIYRNHLPDLQTPPALLQKVLAQVPKPKKRFSWFRLEAGSFWRPALTGAFVMALTLVGLYQYKEHRNASLQVAQKNPVTSHLEAASPIEGGTLHPSDLSLARAQTRPIPQPAWRQPRMGNGLVSFASYGADNPGMGGAAYEEIYGLEQEAQNSIAQFSHQQALRMHALGDHRGAAEALAALIRKYPNYPRAFEALALRIGCLFELGQVAKAEQELSWLRQSSPELAVLVEQRWRR